MQIAKECIVAAVQSVVTCTCILHRCCHCYVNVFDALSCCGGHIISASLWVGGVGPSITGAGAGGGASGAHKCLQTPLTLSLSLARSPTPLLLDLLAAGELRAGEGERLRVSTFVVVVVVGRVAVMIRKGG